MTSNYMLDSYASFEPEQLMLEAELKKKEEYEKRMLYEQKKFEFRFTAISGYFLRSSWRHKKHFILCMVKSINSFDVMLRIISYISTLFGKMAAYADVSPQSKNMFQQVVIDHDRGLEYDCLKETACEDLEWIATIPERKLMMLIMDLLRRAGGGLLRKVYIPIVSIYNKKLLEHARLKELNIPDHRELNGIFDEPEPDDTDKYPRDHPITVEVEKLRKKWDETIDKYRRELFPVEKRLADTHIKATAKQDKQPKASDKSEKVTGKAAIDKNTGGKAVSGESMDWIQMLPIWIVKKILDYFDLKTLQNLKRVNNYWSYACDSLIKDRQTRDFLDNALADMISNVDPAILKECRESEGFFDETSKRPDSPRQKRTKKLINRGAILESMRPRVRRSDQTRTCLVTSLPKNTTICDPLEKLTVFPRLIKEDLLLYKKYPCILKDVDILFDVYDSLRKQRDTLSYIMSQQLSDTFSMSEANLADW